MSTDRLTDLEVKLAFQEHTIGQLDEVIRELMQRMERAESRLEEVVAEQQNAMAPLENPRPPHY